MTYQLIPFLPMPENPSDIEYFWHQILYAIPGFLTFCIGSYISVLGLFSAFRRKEKFYFVSFSVVCFAFSLLALLVSFRATIQSKETLIILHNYLYWIFLLGFPFYYHLMFQLTARKFFAFRVFAILCWITGIYALNGIVKGEAFTGEWIQYPFGLYPVASNYLKPVLLVTAIGVILVSIPVLFIYFRKQPQGGRHFLVLGGLNAMAVLTFTNLPSVLGFSIFPGGGFLFIPMIAMAYGVFRSDFLNLNELLFRKNGLFYFISSALSFMLFVAALSVALFLKPGYSSFTYAKPYFLIPLASAVIVFWLAIYIAGSDPQEKLNMVASSSLVITGVFLIVMIISTLDLPVIVYRRLEQILYIIFVLAPSIQFRFAFLAMGEKIPRYTPLIDIGSVLLMCLAFTPYFFSGYYEYSFGRISGAGTGLKLYGIFGTLVILLFIPEWLKARRKRKNTMGDLVGVAIALGGVLFALNLPATMGYHFYSVGSLQFIPAVIIAYAVVRHGVIPVYGKATSISNRLSSITILLVPIAMVLYFSALFGMAPVSEIFLHIILVSVPLLLSFYMLTFVLTRPISRMLDENYVALKKEKLIAERSQKEIEKLNEIVKKINSTSDLNEILDYIFAFLEEEYFIEAAPIYFADQKKNELYCYHFKKLPYYTEAMLDVFKHHRIPLDENGGIVWRTFLKQKITFIGKKFGEIKNYSDRLIWDTFRLKSIVLVPLVINGNTIAMTMFSSRRHLSLSRNDLAGIARFSEHIAGAIYNSMLLRNSEDAKIISDAALFEIKTIDAFTKKINSNLSLDLILDDIFSYIQASYGFEGGFLILKDEEKEELYAAKIYSHVKLPEENFRTLKNMRIKLDDNGGTHYAIYLRQRPFFISEVEYHERLSDSDKDILNNLNFKSVLYVPLLVQDKVIGILDFVKFTSSLRIPKAEIEKISLFCDQIAGAVYSRSLLHVVQKEKEKSDSLLKTIRKDLLIAQKIQNNILPKDFDKFPALNIHAKYLPMTEVGGDIFDITEINPGYFRFFLADATGHGVQAALITVAIKSEYENSKSFSQSPEILMEKLNSDFTRRYRNMQAYFTCIILDVDIAAGKIYYTSAGHPDQIIWRKGSIEKLERTGGIIGMAPNAQFRKEELPFTKDSRLLLFTDGLYEQFDKKRNLFGFDKLIELIGSSDGENSEGMIKIILENLNNHLKGSEKQDDITVIGVEQK